jgi:hypothetical protein
MKGKTVNHHHGFRQRGFFLPIFSEGNKMPNLSICASGNNIYAFVSHIVCRKKCHARDVIEQSVGKPYTRPHKKWHT